MLYLRYIMTLEHEMKLSLVSLITPADTASTGDYRIGLYRQAFTVPTAATVIVPRALTLTSGVGKVFQPDTNVYDGGAAVPDPDGVTVALSKIYCGYLLNTHATLDLSLVTSNFTTVELSATVPPGGVLLFGPWENGQTIGATTDFTLTGVSGATTCELVYWGS